MSHASYLPATPADADDRWRPSDPLRRWLTFGMLAVLLDGVLQVMITVLALRSEDQQGFTADVVLENAAILPQIVVLMAYLRLSREAASRGLWKGSLGLFLGGWLAQWVSLGLDESMRREVAILAVVLGGAGIVGLVILFFTKRPRLSEVADDSVAVDPDDSPASGASGCLGVLGMLILFRVLGRLVRGGIPWLPTEVDTWAIIELAAFAALVAVYGIWFAAVKIRLRHRLGGTAAVLGIVELSIALLHIVMLAFVLAKIASLVMSDPEIDDKEFSRQFTPLWHAFSIASCTCVVLWSLLTAWFFAAVRKRAEPDWREEMFRMAER